MLAAGLLALLLGWSALQEGHASPPATGGSRALDAGMPAPQGAPPCERITALAEASAEPARGGKPAALPGITGPGMRSALVAKAMAGPLQAPRPQADVPRRPPGQAPPSHA